MCRLDRRLSMKLKKTMMMNHHDEDDLCFELLKKISANNKMEHEHEEASAN